MADAPNGFFTFNSLFLGRSLSPATLISRGARLRIPDLRAADTATREAYFHGMGTWLTTLGADEAVQFSWRVDSDYEAELETYRRQTIEQGARGWCKAVRDHRYHRFMEKMQDGTLRRQRLDVFVGKRANTLPKNGLSTAEQYDAFMEQMAHSLEERLDALGNQLPGSHVDVMGDREHFHTWRQFLNPTLRVFGEDLERGPDLRATILENCCSSDGITLRDGDGTLCFKMDNQYHAILTLTQWPLETYFGIIWTLTDALNGNYAYTLNCYPLNVEDEVKRSEIELKRLNTNIEKDQKDSAHTLAAKKKAKIAALTEGYARPFSVLPVIRVWDSTPEGLQARLSVIKNALVKMSGARYYQVDSEAGAKNLFFESLPGNLSGRYRYNNLFAMAGAEPSSCFLQDLIPLSASHTGHADEGEVLWDGSDGNIVGVRTFANGVPQHGGVIGTSRVGKSSQVIDYISQTDCFFKFRSIVEEGFSYASVVKLLGGESIVLTPDGDVTLNYFDTQGAPLTQSQIAISSGLLGVMGGTSADPEVNIDRKAMYGEYIIRLYDQAWEDFRRKNPEKEDEAARLAMLIERRRKASGANVSLDTTQMWSDLQVLRREAPEKFQSLLATIKDSELVEFSKRFETAPLVRNIGLSMLRPEEFPTHSGLVSFMQNMPLDHHDQREVARLATRLKAWTRTSANGCLFDGVSNRSIKSRLIHWELSLLPSSNKELKEAVLYLLSNVIRQHVITLPRAWRKEGIFEEPSRYLHVGGASDLFSEMYAQMGKFSYRMLPVTQQYAQLAASPVAGTIFGNAKQFWIFKQNDLADLDDLANRIGLSGAVTQMIRGYTAPEYQKGDEKYSEMAVWCQEGGFVSCGTARNYASREMLYVAESSGAIFDERMKVLEEYEDPVEGVMLEAEKIELAKRGRKKARTL